MSILGQAGQLFSPDVSQKCREAQVFAPAIQAGYYIGIAFTLGGLFVAIAGAFRIGTGTGMGKRGKVEKI